MLIKHYVIACFILLVTPIILHSQDTQKILVLNYEYKSQIPSGQYLAEWIPSQIQVNLGKSKYITLIERKKIDEILKEHSLAQSGLIDAGMAIKAGKMAGADKILAGEIQFTSDKKYNINSRLIDVERGYIEGQWLATEVNKNDIESYISEVAQKIISQVKTAITLDNLVKLENLKNPFSLKLSLPKNQFHFNEILTLTAIADTNCYLLIFDVGTSGKIHLLFPNKNQTNNYIEAGQKIEISNIKVLPPAGTEFIKAIATLDSISLKKMVESGGTSGIYQYLGNDIEQFSRDLDVMISFIPDDKWFTSGIKFEILE